MAQWLVPVLMWSAAMVGLAMAASVRAEDKRIGTTAEEWQISQWFNTQPMTLKEQRGKVVLIRWWTGPQCPHCKATAPALNEFHELYKDKGLVVIGFYHHKTFPPLNPDRVKQTAADLGFQFPIGIDAEWRTLRRWWLNDGQPNATSASFLIDRKGVIRYIHPGVKYVKGDADYKALKGKIEELLKEIE